MSSRKKAKAKAAAAAAAAAEAAAKAEQEAKAGKKKKGGLGRLLMLTVIGGAAALVASEPLRNKVLDLLFGAEEEFQYSPPIATAPSEPASSLGAA